MVVAEIPKVTDDMVSGDAVEKEEGKPFVLFGREFSRKLCGASHRRRGLRHLTCQLDGRFQCPCGVPVKG